MKDSGRRSDVVQPLRKNQTTCSSHCYAQKLDGDLFVRGGTFCDAEIPVVNEFTHLRLLGTEFLGPLRTREHAGAIYEVTLELH